MKERTRKIFIASFIILLFGLGSYLIINNPYGRINVNGLKINRQVYNGMLELNKDSELFQICSMEDKTCVYFKNIEEKKYQGPIPQGCDEEYFREHGVCE